MTWQAPTLQSIPPAILTIIQTSGSFLAERSRLDKWYISKYRMSREGFLGYWIPKSIVQIRWFM